jgi:hypothetical protein
MAAFGTTAIATATTTSHGRKVGRQRLATPSVAPAKAADPTPGRHDQRAKQTKAKIAASAASVSVITSDC